MKAKHRKLTRKEKIEAAKNVITKKDFPIKTEEPKIDPAKTIAPKKVVIAKPAIATEIWKSPSGKLCMLKNVEGEYVTPEGLTYDRQSLLLLNWSPVSA